MTEPIRSEAQTHFADVAHRAAQVAAVLRWTQSYELLRNLAVRHSQHDQKTPPTHMEISALAQTANPSFNTLRDVFESVLEEQAAAEQDPALTPREIAGVLALAVLTEKSSLGTPEARHLRNSTSQADIAKTMHHAHQGEGNPATAADRHREQLQSTLLHAWVEAVGQTTFVPGGRAQIRAILYELLRRLAAALVAEPFDAMPGYRVGYDLVDSKISSPKALGKTLSLLQQQFLPCQGLSGRQASERLSQLLGHLATGFAEAMRNVALGSAIDINRAERAAWRDKQMTLHRRLQHALLYERLTDLPNRAQLVSRLDEMRDEPRCARLGICLVNLDRFRSVNDNFGRDRGDQLLRDVARRLRDLADQSGHFLAHLGSDEFALVVENPNSDDMTKLADLVLRILREPFNINDHRFEVAASVGIEERAAAEATSDELLRNADITLGWAKADHRGHWAVFDQDRYTQELHQHALAADMPAALTRGEFILAYQPLVRLADRRIIGVESLARWHHPTHGVIMPDQFIPLAENTGLIVALGLNLLEQACQQAVAWRRHSGTPLMISVNLAVAQVHTPELAAAIIATLERTGLPAEQLQLEITESTIVNPASATLDTLHTLACHGIRIAIDDFGTGYSSLSYLAELPIHAVKLAPGFLHGIDDSDNTGVHPNNIILPAIISLSRDLKLAVTAEGIETATQARKLTALGCEFGQGFYFGHPTIAEHLNELLSRPDQHPRQLCLRAFGTVAI